jgi:hypothetical protein
MIICTLLRAGLRMPLSVTLGSPIDGVLVMFSDKDDAAVALSIPKTTRDRVRRKIESFFTI